MKTALKIIFIISFLFLPALTYAAANSYHVTQKGAGQRTGKSLANAWSVSDFNNSENWSTIDHQNRIDPGDTVYFSGTITSALNSQGSGSSGNYITLDGYQADDTTFMNLSEEEGRAKIDRTLASDYGIKITGEDYITIQDFEFTDINQAILIGTNYPNIGIVMKRNFIYECDNGIYIGDGYNITVGGSSGHGNVIKNVGRDTSNEDIAIAAFSTSPHDIIISYNHLYANSSSWGIDGIMNVTNSYDVLIEYNSIHGHNHSTAKGENGIDLKRDISNVIIRYNEIYDHDWESEIIINTSPLGGGDSIYIYGNYIHDGGSAGIFTQYHSDPNANCAGNYIFSNVIHDMGSKGISINCHGSTTIFNNTVAENDSGTSSSDAGMYISSYGVPDTIIKNNIFYKNCPTDSTYYPAYSIRTGVDRVRFIVRLPLKHSIGQVVFWIVRYNTARKLSLSG